MVKGGVPFHMASDQAGNVGRAYGVWDENQGIELRGRFIIDPDGVIQAMEVLTPPVGRRFAEVGPPDPGIPTRARLGRQRSHPCRLGARQIDPQTWPRPGGQGMGGLEARHGVQSGVQAGDSCEVVVVPCLFEIVLMVPIAPEPDTVRTNSTHP